MAPESKLRGLSIRSMIIVESALQEVMPMRIRSFELSLLSWRAFSGANAKVEASQRRLSSGLRVNAASDDAGSIGMSQSFKGQVNGLIRASQNAVDGISLLQVAESALVEIHGLLQRANELSVQAANDTLTTSDKQVIQVEITGILAEVDRISEITTFNGRHILSKYGNSTAVARVVTGLKSGWLRNAANVILANYGISGDGSPLRIVLETSGTESAWISGTPGLNNRLDNLELHVNLADIGLSDTPDGGIGPIYDDRMIARALTQAVLARHSEYNNLPDWFRSGTADYIAGGDELFSADIAAYGLANVINAIGTPWINDSIHRSSAYLATKYMASRLGFFTMADFMGLMSGGLDFDTSFGLTVGVPVATFLVEFMAPGPGGGADFASTFNLTDADVGAIGGGDASSVIPNGGTFTNDPLAPDFATVLGFGATDENEFILQVGPNKNQTIKFSIPSVSTLGLNLLGIDVVGRADEAIQHFQTAIHTLSAIRGQLGSVTNRLEHAMSNNSVLTENQQSSYSRIVDADMAIEIAVYTRHQLMLSASTAALAQANSLRAHVMWLLRDLVDGGFQARADSAQ